MVSRGAVCNPAFQENISEIFSCEKILEIFSRKAGLHTTPLDTTPIGPYIKVELSGGSASRTSTNGRKVSPSSSNAPSYLLCRCCSLDAVAYEQAAGMHRRHAAAPGDAAACCLASAASGPRASARPSSLAKLSSWPRDDARRMIGRVRRHRVRQRRRRQGKHRLRPRDRDDEAGTRALTSCERVELAQHAPHPCADPQFR